MKLSNEYKVFARITQVLCVRDENVMKAKSEPIKRQKADPIKWNSRTNLDLVSYFFLSFIFPFRDTFSFLCVSFSLFFMHNNAGAPRCVLYRSSANKLEYFIKKREREFLPFFGRTPTHKFELLHYSAHWRTRYAAVSSPDSLTV